MPHRGPRITTFPAPSEIPGVGEPWGIRILRLLWATGMKPQTLAQIWDMNLSTLERIVHDGGPTRNRSAFVRALGQTERWYAEDLARLDRGEIQIFSKWEWTRVDPREALSGPFGRPEPGVGYGTPESPEVGGEVVTEIENFRPQTGNPPRNERTPGDPFLPGGEGVGAGREGIRYPKMGSRRPRIGRPRVCLLPGGMVEVARVKRQYFWNAETGKGEWIWLIEREGPKKGDGK